MLERQCTLLRRNGCTSTASDARLERMNAELTSDRRRLQNTLRHGLEGAATSDLVPRPRAAGGAAGVGTSAGTRPGPVWVFVEDAVGAVRRLCSWVN
jgi:hypothetical protein